jgi:hypothetical protein
VYPLQRIFDPGTFYPGERKRLFLFFKKQQTTFFKNFSPFLKRSFHGTSAKRVHKILSIKRFLYTIKKEKDKVIYLKKF